MIPFYEIIILAFLILALSVYLSKTFTVYESYRRGKKKSTIKYPNIGCNGDTLDGCIKYNGKEWCAKNCRNATPTSYCNGSSWSSCLQKHGQVWCQENCKINNTKYTIGIPNIL